MQAAHPIMTMVPAVKTRRIGPLDMTLDMRLPMLEWLRCRNTLGSYNLELIDVDVGILGSALLNSLEELSNPMG